MNLWLKTVHVGNLFSFSVDFTLDIISIVLPTIDCVFVMKPTRCTNFKNLFWHETLYVSDSSSVHHQKFIHCTLSNGICHTGL